MLSDTRVSYRLESPLEALKLGELERREKQCFSKLYVGLVIKYSVKDFRGKCESPLVGLSS